MSEKVCGVDISVNQSAYAPINGDIFRSKVDFCVVRCSNGAVIDKKYDENSALAYTTGAWGNYHVSYCEWRATAKEQGARHGKNELARNGQIPGWLDFERPGKLTGKGLRDWFYAYVMEYEQTCGRKAIIYTSPKILKMLSTSTNKVVFQDWMYERDLAIANYEVAKPQTYGLNWVFWQWKIHRPATDYGCAKPPKAAYGIDLDVYNGSMADFRAEFGIGEVAKPDDGMVTTMVLSLGEW